MRKKLSIIEVLGFIGIVIWISAIPLRETSLMNIREVRFLLGVAPNFGASWALVSIIASIYPVIFKKDYSNKVNFITVTSIFILAIGSEIVHDLFFNSPFDIYDIIATILALGIILVGKCISSKSAVIKD